jgi:hypothetical protein
MKKILGLLLFTTAAFAGSIQTNTDKQFVFASAPRNYILNSGAEKNELNVTDTGDMHSRTTGVPLAGVGVHTLDADSNSDTAEFLGEAFLDTGLLGLNCEAKFKMLGDASLYTVTVKLNGSAVTNAITLPNTGSNSRIFSVNFPCSVLASPSILISSTSASAASFKMDEVYLGEATNLSEVSQAQAIVHATKSGNQNIAVSSSTTVTTWTETIDTYNEFNITTGIFTASSPKRLVFSGRLYVGNQTSSEGYSIGIRKNGSSFICDQFSVTPASLVTNTGMHLSPCIVDAIAGDTFDFYVDSAADTSYDVVGGVNTQLEIMQFPTQTQLAISPQLQYWKVDANISGANPSLGTANVSSYTGIENGSLTLTNNSGTGNITAQIPCSSTNSPSGTTCSAGSESVGVAFTPTGTFPQEVLACVSFSHDMDLGATGRLDTTFQIVETPTNAQTISQEGKSRLSGYTDDSTFNVRYPYRLCGNFTFTSGGQKALRLMFEQAVVATVASNVIVGDAGASVGQRDIHWEVYPINQGAPTPLLVGSIVSDSVNVKAEGDTGVTTMTSGVYTPTTSNLVNLDSATVSSSSWHFIRFGKQVSFSGRLALDATTGGATITSLDISLPVTADFASSINLSGACVGNISAGTTNPSGFMNANSTTDKMALQFNATGTSAVEWRCSGMYTIP